MILAGVLFVAAAVVVYLIANPFGADRPVRDPEPVVEQPGPEPQPEPDPTPDPDPTPEPEAAAEPAPQPEPIPEPDGASDQQIIPATTRTVRAGDTLYEIAQQAWAEPFLWPLLLEANEELLTDPDYLRPGQRITIPAWVTIDSGLTPAQRERLSQAHVLAYTHYRTLGSDAIGLGAGQPAWWLAQLGNVRMNKAVWVLYSGLRYDEDLIDSFAAQIRDEDANQVREFVERFGLPPNRR